MTSGLKRIAVSDIDCELRFDVFAKQGAESIACRHPAGPSFQCSSIGTLASCAAVSKTPVSPSSLSHSRSNFSLWASHRVTLSCSTCLLAPLALRTTRAGWLHPAEIRSCRQQMQRIASRSSCGYCRISHQRRSLQSADPGLSSTIGTRRCRASTRSSMWTSALMESVELSVHTHRLRDQRRERRGRHARSMCQPDQSCRGDHVLTGNAVFRILSHGTKHSISPSWGQDCGLSLRACCRRWRGADHHAFIADLRPHSKHRLSASSSRQRPAVAVGFSAGQKANLTGPTTYHVTAPISRRVSRRGDSPKNRLYSRLNCEALT